MNRREFLKLSAASVAGAGATAYISPASFAAAAGVVAVLALALLLTSKRSHA